jgi:hypothetical protein
MSFNSKLQILAVSVISIPALIPTPSWAADIEAPKLAEKCKAPGSFYAPSIDTCIDFGGYVWAEGYYNSFADYPAGYDRNYGIGTLGLTANSTTDTAYGPFKVFVDVRLQYRSADAWSDGPSEFEVVPWNIYADYAGFTVGYQGSKFDFYSNANVQGTDPATIGDSEQILLAAYTHQFAHGWSATLSVEQGWGERQGGVNAADANSSAVFGQNSKHPDFVAAVGQTTDWGQFQLSGALHQVRTETDAGSGYTGASDPKMWGYAVQGGVMVDLPHIASGDSLYLQAAYVDGAVTYLGLVNASGDFAPPDAYIDANGDLSGVTGWNLTAQYLHNWSPTLQSALFGGVARFKLANSEAEATYGASGGTNYNVGANLTWNPIQPLSLTAQYDYNMYKANDFINTGNGLPKASQDAHQILLMTQYTF